MYSILLLARIGSYNLIYESIKKCGALSLSSNREGLFLTQQKPGYRYRK